MGFCNKNTEKCLVSQIDPGVRIVGVLLLAEHYPIHIDSHNGEVGVVLLFSLRSVCPLPMVAVHGLENPPLSIARQLHRHGRAIEALIKRWKCCFASKFINEAVSSQCCIGKPVAHHNSIVAEGKLIEPVNDYPCTNRQDVGSFACNHICFGFKLNIKSDGVSIFLFPIQPAAVVMSDFLLVDNGTQAQRIISKIEVTKCQQSEFSVAPERLSKSTSNLEANHVSNHDCVLVIYVISTNYKGVSKCVNHGSNHESNHNEAILTAIFEQVTTGVTTRIENIKAVLSNTYVFGLSEDNYVSNHTRLKFVDSKMMPTTQVTTMIVLVITEISIIYIGVILSANHVSNHGCEPKVSPEKTYSSILYYTA